MKKTHSVSPVSFSSSLFKHSSPLLTPVCLIVVYRFENLPFKISGVSVSSLLLLEHLEAKQIFFYNLQSNQNQSKQSTYFRESKIKCHVLLELKHILTKFAFQITFLFSMLSIKESSNHSTHKQSPKPSNIIRTYTFFMLSRCT